MTCQRIIINLGYTLVKKILLLILLLRKFSSLKASTLIVSSGFENLQGGEIEILLAIQGNNLISDVCNISIDNPKHAKITLGSMKR